MKPRSTELHFTQAQVAYLVSLLARNIPENNRTKKLRAILLAKFHTIDFRFPDAPNQPIIGTSDAEIRLIREIFEHGRQIVKGTE